MSDADKPGNVAPLFGGPAPGEPSEAVIARLRELLDEAERGEIVGLAYAIARPNDQAMHGYETENGALFATAAGVMALHSALARALAEQD